MRRPSKSEPTMTRKHLHGSERTSGSAHRGRGAGAPPADGRAGRIGVLAAAALLVTACGPAEDPAIAEGRALYEANCEICHGATGIGNGPMAATLPVQPVSLIEHVGHHSMAEMNRLILGGIPPAMPPHNLSEEQVGLIVGYVWTLVPEDQVAALRDMQRQIEEMNQAAGGHPQMPGMQIDSSGGAMPQM